MAYKQPEPAAAQSGSDVGKLIIRATFNLPEDEPGNYHHLTNRPVTIYTRKSCTRIGARRVAQQWKEANPQYSSVVDCLWQSDLEYL